MGNVALAGVVKLFMPKAGMAVDEYTAQWKAGDAHFIAHYRMTLPDQNIEDAIYSLNIHTPSCFAAVTYTDEVYMITGTRSDLPCCEAPKGWTHLGRAFQVAFLQAREAVVFLRDKLGIVPAEDHE